MREKFRLFYRYLILDMKRAFISWKFLGGIAGVFLVLGFAALETKQWHISVLNAFSLIVYSMPFLLTLIFTTFVFGQCFCEDIAHRYIRLLIIRGNIKTYVLSKVITIFFSSMITMTVGIFLFVLVLHVKYPWINLEESTYEALLMDGSFRYFLSNKNFLLYFFSCGVQYGLLAGLMSVFAALFSLIYHDTLFVLSIPLVLWYCIQYYGAALFSSAKLNLNFIYDIQYNVWDNDICSFLYACFVAAVIGMLLGVIIYKLIKRQVI